MVFKRLTVILVFEIFLKKRLPVTVISKLNDNRLPVLKNFRLLPEPVINLIRNAFKPWLYVTTDLSVAFSLKFARRHRPENAYYKLQITVDYYT